MRTPPRHAPLCLAAFLALVVAPVAHAAPVDPAIVRDAVERAWADQAIAGFTVEVTRIPSLSSREEGNAEVEPVLPDGPWRAGPHAIPVNLRIDGRVVARGLANVVVRQRVTVWVPVRAIERGASVTAADLRREPRTYDRDPHRLFAGPGEGTWIAARDLEIGRVLRPTDLRPKPDVTAGDEILLVSRAGEATVAVPGRVRRSGSVGDTVLVLNPVTGSIVRARLIDPNTAELIRPGPGERRSQ